MARVFVTGSVQGLGLAAAKLLVDQGHHVVGHARNGQRADDMHDALPQIEAVAIGEMSSLEQTCRVADQANRLGPFDAVIHNAGVGPWEKRKITTEDGHAHVFAVNTLSVYTLTALMERPSRLVYMSSGMHRSGETSFEDLDWEDREWDGRQAYCDSKLFVTAMAFALARRWPDVKTNSLEPGWVPTRMGGPKAPGDLSLAHITQVWLAASDEPEATVSGEYFFHQRPQEAHLAVRSVEFQDALLDLLAQMTDVKLAAG